ncbi:MAG TPA: hypothetical protein VMZ22_12035 [Acidimicrobiales bacterium]|nr:hypothetical protein [Acidimicrobiales bacterium]
MAGALLAVLTIGVVIGLIGRLTLPGRHGLAYVLRRDPRHAPRLLSHDAEARWEVTAGLMGALGGYIIGRLADAQAAFGPSPTRWVLSVIGAVVLVSISVASEMIERSRYTRRIGMHR